MKKIALIFLILVGNIKLLSSQSTNNSFKVGLVLSGGGAKGMAHIGTLKLIDSLQIKIDYIAGTSMGSIMGGLYAIGYSGKELETFCKETNWDELFDDRVPYKNVAIEEKEEFGKFIGQLPVLDKKVRLPQGLLIGTNLYDKLAELCLPAYTTSNFDSLHIPFICNGANIEDGENIIFEQGYLPQCLRASMAIPSVFRPIMIDTNLYVDGGMVRNFLVDDMKNKGVDFIIGSYTGGTLLNKKDLHSLTQIMQQSSGFLGILDAQKYESMCNILIKNKLSGYEAGAFKKADSIIARGDLSANEQYSALKELADKQHSMGITKENYTKPQVDSLIFEQIIIYGCENTTPKFVKGRLGIKEFEKISVADFILGIQRIYGSMYFESVVYKIVPSKKNTKNAVLIMDVKENPKTLLRFALHYDTEFGPGIVFNTSIRNVLLKNSRAIVAIDFAEQLKAKITYLKYLNKKQTLNYNTVAYFEKNNYPIIEAGKTSSIYNYNSWKLESFFQNTFKMNTSFSLGYQYEYNTIKPKIISPLVTFKIKKIEYQNHCIAASFKHNSLNKIYFPTKGLYINLNGKYVFNSDYKLKLDDDQAEIENTLNSLSFNPYTKAQLIISNYSKLSKKITLVQNFDAGFIIGNRYNTFDEFIIGNVERQRTNGIPFYGYKDGEENARQLMVLTLGLQYEFISNFYLNANVSGGTFSRNSFEYYIENFYEEKKTKQDAGAAIGIAYNSKFGPIGLTLYRPYSYEKYSAYFTVGYKF